MKHEMPERVEIEWEDAVRFDDSAPDDSHMRCWEIGYLIEKSERYVTIAREWGPETGEYRFFMIIPTPAIVKIKKLGYKPRCK